MFAKDGYGVIAKAVLFAFLVMATGYYFMGVAFYISLVLGLFLIVFTLYFFRDPDRVTPTGEHLVISPADGKVIEIKKVFEGKYLDSEATQVSIFLSPLDVHVNRIPLSGVIQYAEYIPGEYLVAWHEKASELNERSEFGVRHSSGARMFFRQITGYVARRIVFHIKEGDEVTAGDRFGMMKFGSRMDLVYTDEIILNVKPGDVVVGGETIIGQVNMK
ncbi:MAG TPA: phosphatidylserine decarboxylase family protein [Bacteroidetes bacterium]|nr:phosphatidylserine decarboxylase family protein [Bacteroidota bacterium]